MHPQLHIPTPVNKVDYPLFDKANIHVYVKRDDLIHPLISGNKWRKLKYHLASFKKSHNSVMVTFGGAFSNHVYAFGHACNLFDIKGVAIIRGEKDQFNPTIKAAESCGIDLHFVNRSDYRLKEEADSIKSIIDSYDKPMIIPEGGSSHNAWNGLIEMAEEIIDCDIECDFIAVAAGTGCTSGVIINRLKEYDINIEVFSALKGNFMRGEIKRWAKTEENWSVMDEQIFGGYGKVNQELVDFINNFFKKTGIPLDPVYNGKLMYAVCKRIVDGYYPEGSRLLWIHTGGLQGIDGFNYMWKGKYEIFTDR